MAGWIISNSPTWLWLGFTVALAGSATATELQVAQYGAPWCETLPSLKPYVEGILARDTEALLPLQDCVWLKAGVRVEILKDYADFGGDGHVVKVRVFGNGTFVDGYSLSIDVVER